MQPDQNLHQYDYHQLMNPDGYPLYLFICFVICHDSTCLHVIPWLPWNQGNALQLKGIVGLGIDITTRARNTHSQP